jgi:hypothetical protein
MAFNCSNVADVAVRASHSDSILNFSIAALLTSEPHFRAFSDLGVANLVRPKFDLILMTASPDHELSSNDSTFIRKVASSLPTPPRWRLSKMAIPMA